jgi:hypothetical protein
MALEVWLFWYLLFLWQSMDFASDLVNNPVQSLHQNPNIFCDERHSWKQLVVLLLPDHVAEVALRDDWQQKQADYVAGGFQVILKVLNAWGGFQFILKVLNAWVAYVFFCVYFEKE